MKSKKLLTVVSLLLMVLSSSAVMFAQEPSKVSGRVLDEDGNPLVGAFVSAKGTNAGTVTDVDGNFTLSVPVGSKVLLFSMLGQQEKELPYEVGKTWYQVVLMSDTQMIEETVVVGYGTMIKRELTSSVSSVNGTELSERASAANVLQSMAGKMAGVQITSTSGRPGGNTRIRVRGMGSINASSSPLYVVDGVVDVDPNMINSSDIENIDVLKDAAATAMYGAKGANGVVIITTKSGSSSTGSITYDAKAGVGVLARNLDMMDADQYMSMQALAYGYSGQNMPHLTSPMENLFNYAKDASGNYLRDDNGLLIASPLYNTSWQKEALRSALTMEHNLSFSQSKGDSKIYSNIGYQDVQGLLKNTYSKRLSGTINASTKVNKWLDLSTMLSISRTEANSPDNEGGTGQTGIRNVIEMPPIVPVQYPDGKWGEKGDYPQSEQGSNPVQQLKYMDLISRNNYILMNIGADVHLTDDLTLTVRANYQNNSAKSTDVRKAGLRDYSPESSGNQAYINDAFASRWSNEDYLTYNKKFFNDKLKSSFVVGASWYSYYYENSYKGNKNMTSIENGYHDLSIGDNTVTPSSSVDENKMNSYYFRTNQVWDNRYMLGVTLRADGASNFGDKHKYGFFPSVSAAWAVSSEPWFDGLKNVINQMKIRVSYGEVGNSSIGNYAAFARFGSGSVTFNNGRYSFVTLSQLGNSDLSWETSKQFDAGVDLSFFNDRVQIISDFYIKRNCDLLFNVEIPASSGYGTTPSNLGVLRNIGFEFTLNSHLIDNPEFKWDLDFIASRNKTIVEKFYGTHSTHGGLCQEGEEYARWYGKKLIGTWSIEEAEEASLYGRTPGDYKLEDVNNDHKYDDADGQYLGRAVPLWELSLVNNFSWKGFNLMVDLGASLGFKVQSFTQNLCVGQAIYTNSFSDLLGAAWTPDNQNTKLAQLRLPTDPLFGNNTMGDLAIMDGDYLRVRNISISYNFKHGLLKNFKAIKGLVMGVSAENVYLFTKYAGYDPECGWGSGDDNSGYDWLAYPKPLTITGNIKITF